MSNDENNSASSMMVSPSDARKIINHALDVVQEREQEGDDPSVTLGELVTTMRRNLDDGAITEGIKRYEAELPDLSRGVQQLAAHLQSKLMFYYQHGNVPGYAVETSIEVPGSREHNEFTWMPNVPAGKDVFDNWNRRLQEEPLYGKPNFIRYYFRCDEPNVFEIRVTHHRVTYTWGPAEEGPSGVKFTMGRVHQELFDLTIRKEKKFWGRERTVVQSNMGKMAQFVARYLSAKGISDFNNHAYAFAVENLVPTLHEKMRGTSDHMQDLLTLMDD